MIYDVFNSNGNVIFPTQGGGGLLSFSGPVNQGDTVLLNLYFTSTGQVEMVASDQSTGATASEVYSAQAATDFVGAFSNPNGFFTGLMTEWYHNESYYGSEQQVVYSDYGSSISSAWMSIDEWDPQTGQTLFADTTPSPVTYSNPTLLQPFSSHNATEASDAYEFITGYVAPPLSVSIPLSFVALDVGQSQLLTPTVSGGMPPYSYQWYLNGLPVLDATGATWIFEPASAGFYFVYVNVTDSVGAIAISNTVTVTADAAPTVSLAPAGQVALDVGQVQTFTASASGGVGTLSYQWYLGGVAVPDATGSTYAFTAASEGSFVVDVLVTDSAPTPVTSAAYPVLLTVNAAPTVSVAPAGPLAMDVGQSELFTATASLGSGALYYQWYIGASLVGTDSSSYTFVASSAGPVQVYVNVTDSASTPYTVKSNVASVTVNYVPSVAVSPSPVALDVGQVQTFTASASGGSGALHFQWYLDGNAVGSDNASYSYNATAGPHEVYVNVTDSASVPVTVESNTASVTVNSAVTVSIAPASWIMDVGQAELFNSSVSGGTSPYAYQWYLNDVAVSGATSATWTFTPGSFGSYDIYVNVTDNVGFRAISNIASVTVNPVLSVSIAPASATLDVGDTLKCSTQPSQVALCSRSPTRISGILMVLPFQVLLALLGILRQHTQGPIRFV
jgi:hypothetical protein